MLARTGGPIQRYRQSAEQVVVAFVAFVAFVA
jgi:hypothetical protein